MKPIILLVLLVLVAPGSRLVEADQDNYVSNESSYWTLTAVLSCPGCQSGTLILGPGQYDWWSTDYSDYGNQVQVDLTIGTGQPGTVFIGTDQSIVAYDNYDGNGMEIFDAIHGTRVQIDGTVKATIFGQ